MNWQSSGGFQAILGWALRAPYIMGYYYQRGLFQMVGPDCVGDLERGG